MTGPGLTPPDEWAEAAAKALHAATVYPQGEDHTEHWAIYADTFRDRARATLAAVLPLVAAECDRAVRDALDAVGRDVEKLRGDVHHLVSPIIGSLRMVGAYPETGAAWLDPDHLAHFIDRLRLVLALLDEAATGVAASDEHRGRHGVGLNHYPALVADLRDGARAFCPTCEAMVEAHEARHLGGGA